MKLLPVQEKRQQMKAVQWRERTRMRDREILKWEKARCRPPFWPSIQQPCQLQSTFLPAASGQLLSVSAPVFLPIDLPQTSGNIIATFKSISISKFNSILVSICSAQKTIEISAVIGHHAPTVMELDQGRCHTKHSTFGSHMRQIRQTPSYTIQLSASVLGKFAKNAVLWLEL